MLKRMFSLMLCLLLVVAVFPVAASAATEEDVSRVRREIVRDYNRALAASGMETLKGYCGLQTSLQLYMMGINEHLITHDGKDQYDTYCNLEYTTGGYKVKTYPASSYSLAGALNALTKNGTRDVYNLLIGFNWTSTEAGSVYGHAIVVYAILDGIMYFAEGFATPMNYTAGGVIACSIEEFLWYYEDWTLFEGIVHFGSKTYVENCTEYASHMFVEANREANLYTEPCNPEIGEVESQVIRTVAKGERLLVTGLFENTVDQFYYRVDDDGTVGYVSANWAEPMHFNFEDVTLSESVAPEALAVGQDFEVSGKVSSLHSIASALHMTVADEAGQVKLSHSLAKQSGQYDLTKDTFNALVDFGSLEQGYYTYELRADCPCYYVQDGQLQARLDDLSLLSAQFRVGDIPEKAQETAAARTVDTKDGWHYENGTWYCYSKGAPRTGWFCCNGVDYYLKEDGSVTTGWAEINGKTRLFTGTGAMRTGWVRTEAGTEYLLSNGVAVSGWWTIDAKRYCFGQDNLLQHDCWITEGENRYYLLSDGAMATGWVDLPDGRFCFSEDGCLVAQSVQEGDQTVVKAYIPTNDSYVTVLQH